MEGRGWLNLLCCVKYKWVSLKRGDKGGKGWLKSLSKHRCVREEGREGIGELNRLPRCKNVILGGRGDGRGFVNSLTAKYVREVGREIGPEKSPVIRR